MAHPSKVDSFRLPDVWRRRILRELEEGESLLWVGQPDPTMALLRCLVRVGPILIVLLILLVGVAWLSWEGIRAGNGGMVIPPVILFCLLIASMVFLWWEGRRARRTLYGLTNRRALVFLPSFLGKMRLTSYFPNQLLAARFHPSWWFGASCGDWVFRQRITRHVTRKTEMGNPLPYEIEESKTVESFGFLLLRDGAAIEPYIRQVVQGDGSFPNPSS